MGLRTKITSAIVGILLLAAPVANATTASAYPRHPKIGQSCQSYDKDFWGWANYVEYRLKLDSRYACYYNVFQRTGPFTYRWTERVNKYSI